MRSRTRGSNCRPSHRQADRQNQCKRSSCQILLRAPFPPPNLLAEIVEALPYRLQKKPCFFPISFSREIKSFSREIKHRRSRPITLFTKPEAFTVAPNPKRATRRDCKPTPPMILSQGLVVRRMICSARRHAFVSNAFRDA